MRPLLLYNGAHMWLALLVIHVVGLVGYNLSLRKSLVAKEDKWVLAAVLGTGLSLPLVPLLFFWGH